MGLDKKSLFYFNNNTNKKIKKIMKQFHFLYGIAMIMLLIVGKTHANQGVTPLNPPIVLIGSFDDELIYKNLMNKVLPHNKQWLGLFCHNKNCVIKPAQVTISDYIEKWELNGEFTPSDKLAVQGKPLALFLGLPTIKVGKVTTWSLGSDSTHNPQLEVPYGDEMLKKFLFIKHYTVKKVGKFLGANNI